MAASANPALLFDYNISLCADVACSAPSTTTMFNFPSDSLPNPYLTLRHLPMTDAASQVARAALFYTSVGPNNIASLNCIFQSPDGQSQSSSCGPVVPAFAASALLLSLSLICSCIAKM